MALFRVGRDILGQECENWNLDFVKGKPMPSSPLRKLKPYKEREYFCDPIQWEKPAAVTALYDRILQKQVVVDGDAVEWLNMWRELESITDTEYSIRYVEMTCDTERPAKESASSARRIFHSAWSSSGSRRNTRKFQRR